MKTVQAYHLSGDNWALVGNTYPIKEILKGVGCGWDPIMKRWVGSLKAVKHVKADIYHRVRVGAYCHFPERIVGAWGTTIKNGLVDVGCTMCDKHHGWAKLLEVLPYGQK